MLLFDNMKVFIKYLISHKTRIFRRCKILKPINLSSFIATYRDDCIEIKESKDIVAMGKRAVYSWLKSMCKIINDLEDIGIYSMNISFASIWRESEIFKLCDFQKIICTAQFG